jgi:hypothetical protein
MASRQGRVRVTNVNDLSHLAEKQGDFAEDM